MGCPDARWAICPGCGCTEYVIIPRPGWVITQVCVRCGVEGPDLHFLGDEEKHDGSE